MGINEAITSEDNWITSYRCHGVEFLRMGSGEAGVKAVINELLGHASGSAHGKGGSMHMYEPDKNFFGGSGIVAAQVPVGTGLGFAGKIPIIKQSRQGHCLNRSAILKFRVLNTVLDVFVQSQIQKTHFAFTRGNLVKLFRFLRNIAFFPNGLFFYRQSFFLALG